MRVNDPYELLDAIPHLRRYAVCVLGCKDNADDLVEGFFREFRSVNGRDGWSCTVSLFKAFHASRAVRTAFKAVDSNSSEAVEDALHAEILTLPINLRQALILVHTVGFSHDEAAEILDCAKSRVTLRVNEAIDRLYLHRYQHHHDRSKGQQRLMTVFSHATSTNNELVQR